MTRLSRRSVLAGAAASGTLLAAPRVARAATRTVTVASLLGPDKPETLVWEVVRDELEARLPGRFDLRVVPNAALGGEREVAEGARLGSVQASLSTVSALSSWVPQSQILDLPFVSKAARMSAARWTGRRAPGSPRCSPTRASSSSVSSTTAHAISSRRRLSRPRRRSPASASG